MINAGPLLSMLYLKTLSLKVIIRNSKIYNCMKISLKKKHVIKIYTSSMAPLPVNPIVALSK